jgi:multiple sugar transport system ATP-binding protein
MSAVAFESVRKVYSNSITAVDGFSLDIADGEFLTIVGPSGSGKSTLLRMVAGLEDISDGEIRIGDDRVNETAPQNRGVAMVFQNYALYPHMTVRKNMAYGLKLTTDLSDDAISEQVTNVAEMMGIGNLLDQKPSQLSGGQQQRVATGRAIVREPDVFLFDEPLSNLDAKLRMHMRTELQRIQEDLNITSIYVTHDQEEAMTMSDRVVILDGGELQQVGTPEEVYNEPTNRFVADFIGSPSMNFFDVDRQGTRLVGDDFEYPISQELTNRVESDELVLGIRPEDITITESATDRSIATYVMVVEPVGSDNYVYLTLGEEPMSTIDAEHDDSVSDVGECTVRVPAGVKPDERDTAEIVFDEKHLHLFDRHTGENLLVQPREVAPTT